MLKNILFLLLIINFTRLSAQNQVKYWILFKAKTGETPLQLSPKTYAQRQSLGLPLNPETDWAINPNHLKKLQDLDIQICQKSRWLNAVSCYLSPIQKYHIELLPFVKRTQAIKDYFLAANHSQHQISSLTNYYLQGEIFDKAGLSGKGIAIGIVDVGFEDALKSPELKHVFKEKRLIAHRDFLQKNTRQMFRKQSPSDWHGREVWKTIAAKSSDNTSTNKGMAPNALFFLARTDDGNSENRIEEDNWIAAIEWLDSLGVRLVNTSLGYSQHFDQSLENYKPQQMDGKTTLISKAAQIAAQEKGMILVVSAGNEGDDPNWRVVSAPADAEFVISVGASASKNRSKVFYSSVGSEYSPFVKPDVVCPAAMGTSFASPQITAFIACLLEKRPTLKLAEIRQVLQFSGHLWDVPNNYLGYGIPRASRALDIINQESISNAIQTPTKRLRLPRDGNFELPISDKGLVIFHKKSDRIVEKQIIIKPTTNEEEIYRVTAMPQIKFTTIDNESNIWEIEWID